MAGEYCLFPFNNRIPFTKVCILQDYLLGDLNETRFTHHSSYYSFFPIRDGALKVFVSQLSLPA